MKIEFSYHARNAEHNGKPWVAKVGDELYFAKSVDFINVSGTTVFDPTFLDPRLSRRHGWIELRGTVELVGETLVIHGEPD